MRWCGGRASAGALTLFLAARANGQPVSAVPAASPSPPAATTPASSSESAPASSPGTGDPSELPARAPARQAPSGADGPPDLGLGHKTEHGAFVHDGFFLRAAVGPGLFQGFTGRSPDSRNYSGGVVSFDAAIGGTVARGFVIGVDLQTSRVFALGSTDSVIDGDEPHLNGVRFAMNSVSLFVDYYPVPTDGLHILGSFGDGWLDVSRPNNTDPPTPHGLLLSAGAGYEWFVSANFSLGVLVRADVGLFDVEEQGSGISTHITTFVPALLGNVTYN